MSGKPRMGGARAALEYFRVPDDETPGGEYAERKQEMVVQASSTPATSPPTRCAPVHHRREDRGCWSPQPRLRRTRTLLTQDPARHVRAGKVSPRLRCSPGMTLLEYFDADVSGRDFTHGKPDPEIFLTSADELGVEPAKAIVIEDAAGRRSGRQSRRNGSDRNRTRRRRQAAGRRARRHRRHEPRRGRPGRACGRPSGCQAHVNQATAERRVLHPTLLSGEPSLSYQCSLLPNGRRVIASPRSVRETVAQRSSWPSREHDAVARSAMT